MPNASRLCSPSSTPITSQNHHSILCRTVIRVPNVMPHGQDFHTMSPSLASSGHAGVAQALQTPPSQVPVPVRQTQAPMYPVPQPPAQQPKPPPRRQSYGLNLLQVHLEDVRDKMSAAELAAGQRKSSSAARASP